MASAKIVLGGEIDVVTGDELHDGLQSVKDEMRLNAKGNGKARRILRPITKAMSLALATGATTVLVIGRPDSGRVWVVTRINLMGDDDHTVKANLLGALYIGDPANVGIGQCVRFGQGIPWTTTENEHAYIVHDREDLFINFTASGSVTGGVVATVTVWEYRDADIESQAI